MLDLLAGFGIEDDEETLAELKTLTGDERVLLERFLKALAGNQEQDPKLHAIRRLLLEDGWLEQQPFELRYRAVQPIPWETCSRVLNADERRARLLAGWTER